MADDMPQTISPESAGSTISNIDLLREISSFLLDPEIAISLFDDAPDPYIVINSSMQIELVNKQAERLLGCNRTDLYDASLSSIMQSADISAPLGSILESLLGNKKSIIATVIPKVGEQFDVSLHFALIIAVQGTFVGITMRKIDAPKDAAKG